MYAAFLRVNILLPFDTDIFFLLKSFNPIFLSLLTCDKAIRVQYAVVWRSVGVRNYFVEVSLPNKGFLLFKLIRIYYSN